MASGIFTLKQQEIALSLNAWSGQKTPAVDYLVIAGGGGGGGGQNLQNSGGGGGSGGVLQGNISVATGSSITVTVGAGGTAGPASTSGPGGRGNDSVFSVITANGGGGGGGGPSTAAANNAPTGTFGSGGGGGTAAGVGGGIGAQGSPSQGNSGGVGSNTASAYGSGGGGGGGRNGNNGTGTEGGNGGIGIASDISGTRTIYAGGGGGGVYTAGSGGSGGDGGGGAGGGNATSNGTAGTANTGGAGGGGGVSAAAASGAGGAGGSGVVIISYPDIYPAPTATTGSPTVSTSGSGAISFSGTSQYIQYADNAAFDVGSGDFTIECWVYRTTTGRMQICGQGDSAGSNSSQSFVLQINASNQLDGYIASGSTFYNATAATTFPSSTWTHVAFVRDGNTTRIYSGGVQVGTASVTGITANNSSNRLGIGSAGEYVAGLLWNGYITNLRIVKGTCLYPSGTTFTPSTTPLTAVSGTSILLLANSGAFSADSSTNAFFPAALGNSPTWVDSSPFSVTGYKNRVYKWTSSGSITF